MIARFDVGLVSAPRSLQEGPRAVQELPKSVQVAPRTGPRGPQTPPKTSLGTTKTSLGHDIGAQFQSEGSYSDFLLFLEANAKTIEFAFVGRRTQFSQGFSAIVPSRKSCKKLRKMCPNRPKHIANFGLKSRLERPKSRKKRFKGATNAARREKCAQEASKSEKRANIMPTWPQLEKFRLDFGGSWDSGASPLSMQSSMLMQA